MRYNEVVKGIFIERPNRFIAHVKIGEATHTVHVKNTGRCKELLIEGATVYLSVADKAERKTKYDLIAVEKTTQGGVILINIDSQIVNDMAEEYLTSLFPNAKIKREVTYKKSRFDFYIEEADKKIFCEVKGVTLENDGILSFPDAPTERGIKHINELCSAVNDGYFAALLFVIQMKGAKYFTPNDSRHKEFGEALRLAHDSGVKILAMDCIVTPGSIVIDKEVQVIL